MYKIGKQFDFCYGHRVWSQELIEGYSEDMCLACRHLHGHQGKIIVFLENMENSSKLERGMVTDFKHLGWFKKWVDVVLDHKFIMDINDPLRDKLFPLTHFNKGDNEKFDKLFQYNDEGYMNLWSDVYKNLSKSEIEMYEGLIFVDFVPTSENLSKWLCDVVNKKMNKIGIKCTHIQFFETPKSESNYFS
jgi:6-pyruvoyltetrahydropterin/6-carboxytetrahydropterin synthase